MLLLELLLLVIYNDNNNNNMQCHPPVPIPVHSADLYSLTLVDFIGKKLLYME